VNARLPLDDGQTRFLVTTRTSCASALKYRTRNLKSLSPDAAVVILLSLDGEARTFPSVLLPSADNAVHIVRNHR